MSEKNPQVDQAVWSADDDGRVSLTFGVETVAELLAEGLIELRKVDDPCPACGGTGTMTVYAGFLTDQGLAQKSRAKQQGESRND